MKLDLYHSKAGRNFLETHKCYYVVKGEVFENYDEALNYFDSINERATLDFNECLAPLDSKGRVSWGVYDRLTQLKHK